MEPHSFRPDIGDGKERIQPMIASRPSAGFTAVFALAVATASALAAHHAPGQAKTGGGPSVRLRDVAASAGLQFTHQHSPSPQKHLIESTPGGLAVFDYNNDGRVDVFLTNGAEIPGLRKSSAVYANRLFRNDGGMRFTDVTEAAGVGGVGYAREPPRATTTTTAAWTSSSPASDRISCSATAATAASRT